MLLAWRRKGCTPGVWAGLGLAALAGTALGSLAGTRATTPSVERLGRIQDDWSARLARQLATVDEAILGKDHGRAIHAWRDAYGLALGSRDWAAMLLVGDAALRIDAVTSRPSGHPTGFRAEARQAYLVALFRARDARAPEGVARVASAFEALGDAETGARARAILAEVGR